MDMRNNTWCWREQRPPDASFGHIRRPRPPGLSSGPPEPPGQTRSGTWPRLSRASVPRVNSQSFLSPVLSPSVFIKLNSKSKDYQIKIRFFCTLLKISGQLSSPIKVSTTKPCIIRCQQSETIMGNCTKCWFFLKSCDKMHWSLNSTSFNVMESIDTQLCVTYRPYILKV